MSRSTWQKRPYMQIRPAILSKIAVKFRVWNTNYNHLKTEKKIRSFWLYRPEKTDPQASVYKAAALKY